MTLGEAKVRLQAIRDRQGYDDEGHPADIKEDDHYEADQILLDFIYDPEIERLFDSIGKWYA